MDSIPAQASAWRRLCAWVTDGRPPGSRRRDSIPVLDLLDHSITETEAAAVATWLLVEGLTQGQHITRARIGRAIAEQVFLDAAVPIEDHDIDAVVTRLAAAGYTARR